MRQYLPENVFKSIQRHLVQRSQRAENGWEAGREEEDTLTGHLGAVLQTDRSRTFIVDGQTWRWRIRYKKFRGRGIGAFEKFSGADGIFQLELDLPNSAERVFKGILFQAKKGFPGRKADVVLQAGRMEEIAPGGSAVFSYNLGDYQAIEGSNYVRRPLDGAALREGSTRLGAYLGEKFLPCKSGLLGMYFDAHRQILVVPTANRGVRQFHVDLKHRISIEVEATVP